jgi:hypothetical protein
MHGVRFTRGHLYSTVEWLCICNMESNWRSLETIFRSTILITLNDTQHANQKRGRCAPVSSEPSICQVDAVIISITSTGCGSGPLMKEQTGRIN